MYSGLISLLDSDPNAIGFVIAHEIGHKLARHVLEINSNLWFWLRGRYNFSHSQQMEFEADYIGLQLMTRACYNPRGALKLFEKLENLEGYGYTFHAYENSHPPNKDRAAEVEKLLPQLETQYKQCKWKPSWSI